MTSEKPSDIFQEDDGDNKQNSKNIDNKLQGEKTGGEDKTTDNKNASEQQQKNDKITVPVSDNTPVPSPSVPEKKKRGRKKKNPVSTTQTSSAENNTDEKKVETAPDSGVNAPSALVSPAGKRKRGRPRKSEKMALQGTATLQQVQIQPQKKRRGRPPKKTEKKMEKKPGRPGKENAQDLKPDKEAEKEKEKGSELEKKLITPQKSFWKKAKNADVKLALKLGEDYKNFLNNAKTEREAVEEIVKRAKKAGFREFSSNDNVLKPGDKLYFINRNKSVALAIVGQRNPVEGLRIIAAHIDSPRLDLKGNPLYEETDYNLALMKTHYYGGIRKYQWVTIPLAIHGVVFTKKGNRVEIKIGENDDDPVFVITDLLPHVARKSQGERKLEEGIKGEELNLVVGHRPIDEKKAKKKIKLWVLNYLNEKYGITEEDFVSAELEVVPALRARDAGFDRMLVAGYGQDDRICAYTQLKAFLEVENPLDTCLALFFDKEEIGSEGNSSVKSRFFDYIVATLVEKCSSVKKRGRGRPRKEEKQQEASESLLLRIMKCLNSSIALSSDVNAAMDPTFRDPWEPMNCSRIGGGVVITKYTGHGGKSGASDANAEFMHYIRTLLNQEEITWQIGELGKVDEGGGGTVAKFLAAYNMDIVDCGPALLAMHAPVELSSKVDILSAYRLYKAFCLDKSKPSK